MQEAFTFKNLIAQTGSVEPTHSFLHVPSYLRDHPERFPYLLDGGCQRPDR